MPKKTKTSAIELYTLKDLQDILHYSERQLFRYLKDKILQGSGGGGKWLFTREDIDNFLRKKKEMDSSHQKAARQKSSRRKK